MVKNSVANYQNNADVFQFVESVWGFKRSDLKWTEWRSRFFRRRDSHNLLTRAFNEADTIEALNDIFLSANRQARHALGITVESPTGLQDSHKIPIFVESAVNCETGYDKVSKAQMVSDSFFRGRNQSSSVQHQDNVTTCTDKPEPSHVGMKRKAESDIDNLRKVPKLTHPAPESEPAVETTTVDYECKHYAFGPDAPKLTHDEVRLAAHALEQMSGTGDRRYTSGIFMRGCFMSLWYFDRMGAVKSQEFDITLESEHEKLVTVAMAIHNCDRTHLGYEPLLQGPSSAATTALNGSLLTLPGGKAMDSNGAITPDDVHFSVTGQVYVQYGIACRGTVVLRVKSQDVDVPKSEDEDLVAKLSWVVATRPAEDSLVRAIRSKVPQAWRCHLPELHYSVTLDAVALALPRSNMALEGAPEQRVLRVLVSTRAFHLYELRSLNDFTQVFYDLVRCHRVVYNKAGVLHKDLSVDNLMFRYSPDGKVLGILNDWDASETVSEARDIPAAQRMGTGPFMAMELLIEDAPKHLYRHDLESFVYILIWCAISYDLDGTDAQTVPPVLQRWMEGTWEEIHLKKVVDILIPMDQRLFKAVRPAFRPIVDTWIRPLLQMLRDANYARLRHLNEVDMANRPPVQPVIEGPPTADSIRGYSSEVRMSRTRWDDSDDDEGDDDLSRHLRVTEVAAEDSVVPAAQKQPAKPWDEETLGGQISFQKVMRILKGK